MPGAIFNIKNKTREERNQNQKQTHFFTTRKEQLTAKTDSSQRQGIPQADSNLTGLFAICYFRVLGKSFRGDLWRFLTCFPGSFRTIFRAKFPEQIAENPLKTFLKPFKGP